jgi:serine/threonine-protein kinase
MSTHTAEDLLAVLRRTPLLQAAQMDELVRSLLPRFPEARALARELVQRGWLTPYQVNQLFQGRGDSLLLGSYVLLERLGEGGMGTVFKARHTRLGRTVALKVIRTDRLKNPDARRRFEREIRAAALLEHPNVALTYDAGEVGGTHFFAMEYVPGTDLAKLVGRSGPLGVTAACDCIRQAALGLQHAFERGLVHRDVKPSNLVLTPGAVVKILDMGLARVRGAVEEDLGTMTQEGTVMGTPDYVAPEQTLDARSVDVRADLYSLGCTLYFLLTGQVPFPGGTLGEKLLKHQLHQPVPVEQLRPDVPPGVAAVVRRLMAKKPEDRFQTPAELVEALGRDGGSATGARHPAAAEQTEAVWAEAVDPQNTVNFGATLQPAPREPVPWRWLLAGGAVLAAGVILVSVLVVRQLWPRSEPAPAPAPALVIPVAADRLWQDSGVDVLEGQAVVLAPEGVWGKGQQACPAGGLDKAPRDRNVLPEAPSLCLLVRVGEEPPVPLPRRQTFRPQRGGRLFFQANDLDLEDNNRALRVSIEGGLHGGEAVPRPGPTPVQAAERDLRPLLARFEGPEVPAEQVRDAVFDFCGKYAQTPQALRAGRLLRKVPPLVNSVGMKLVPIAPGKFVMGSPPAEASRAADEEQHEVVLTRPFFMAAHEVTVGQFKAFVNSSGYQTEPEKHRDAWRLFPDNRWGRDEKVDWKDPGFPQTDQHPVVCVTWNDAAAFCDWLSRKEDRKYTLPTEAQWEYCCRAGSGAKFCFGDDDGGLGQYAWHVGNAERKTHPVGEKKANAWGLADMHGNVWEWTADWYTADYSRGSGRDPAGPGAGETRTQRGGGWFDDTHLLRSARRLNLAPASSGNTQSGFRAVLLR